MKLYIKPSNWEADMMKTEFCCYQFKYHLLFNEDGSPPDILIDTEGKTVRFRSIIIKFCPFCGAKIDIERMIE